MINVGEVQYKLKLLSTDGKMHTITNYVEDLGWEENEKELAAKISFTLKQEDTTSGYITTITKVGCKVSVYVVAGKTSEEVARGYIVTWKRSASSDSNKLQCTCYDDLYHLQKSQDNIYYSSGLRTKQAVKKIFSSWKIPMGSYKGPNEKHGKLVYKAKNLSDILLEILDDAVKKGGAKCVIRATKGKVDIVPYGNNSKIYVFEEANTKSVSRSLSTADLVTRVKVVGQAGEDEQSTVEATVNGKTKYGVRQKIYTRGQDESIEDAKKAAKQILNDDGIVKEDITVQSPDVPFIRKGDSVYVKIAGYNRYYYVLGIQHDADSGSMTMQLKQVDDREVDGDKETKKKNYQIGDTVNFNGGKHYLSSSKGSNGYQVKAGKAKITKIREDSTHPYHLVHADSKSKVNGWVDKGSFKEV